jgi:hypothetical protein
MSGAGASTVNCEDSSNFTKTLHQINDTLANFLDFPADARYQKKLPPPSKPGVGLEKTAPFGDFFRRVRPGDAFCEAARCGAATGTPVGMIPGSFTPPAGSGGNLFLGLLEGVP